MNIPNCPKCNSNYTYDDGVNFVCPECGHEWNENEVTNEEMVTRDANGEILQDGDNVTLIKDLKIGSSSKVIKRGTKVKNIRIVDGDHDITCRIDGFGSMELKSIFLKKI